MKITLIITTIIVLGILSDLFIYRAAIKHSLLKRLFLVKSVLMQIGMVGSVWLLRSDSGLLPMESAQWLFVIYFLVYAPQVLFSLISGMGFLVRKRVRYRRFFTMMGVIASFALMITILCGVTYGRIVPRIESVEMKSDKLPGSFEDYQIVQLSDIHLGNFGSNRNIVERMVKVVNGLNPDLVVVTGDLVNLKSDELEPFKEILSQIKAKDGVFSVLGNHDYGNYCRWDSDNDRKQDVARLIDMQREMGWKMLNNDNAIIRRGADSIVMIGVENWGLPPFYGNGDLRSSYHSLRDSSFKVLLSHNPTHWEGEVIPYSNIDLTLSGHTHAMQMKLTLGGKSYSPASRIYKYWSGLYQKGNQFLYVNDGIGYVGVPMRIGTRPEITEITLQRETK